MELIVRRARGGGLWYWVQSLLAQLFVAHSQREDRDAPAVIARSSGGEEHVLQRTGTYGQALRARDRLQAELDGLGEEEFRRRYGMRPPESGGFVGDEGMPEPAGKFDSATE